MGVYTLTAKTSSDVSDLTTTSGLGHIVLNWTAPEDQTMFATEVWVASSNDRSTATLTATTLNSNFNHIVTPGATRYYWIRSRSLYGGVANWHPTSSTGGVSGTSGYVTTDKTTSGTIGSGSTSVSTSFNTPTISSYGTWYWFLKATWTAQDNSQVTFHQFLVPEFTSISCPAGDSLAGWCRYRLYNNTDGADVPGGTHKFLMYRNFSSIAKVSETIAQVNASYVCGFRGLVLPGKSYSLFAEAMKDRTGSATMTMTIYSQGTENSIATFG